MGVADTAQTEKEGSQIDLERSTVEGESPVDETQIL